MIFGPLCAWRQALPAAEVTPRSLGSALREANGKGAIGISVRNSIHVHEGINRFIDVSTHVYVYVPVYIYIQSTHTYRHTEDMSYMCTSIDTYAYAHIYIKVFRDPGFRTG